MGEHSPAQPTKKSPWIANYKWPIYFFVAVAFWNLVGAGLFGFLINPPIALYYVQGLNLTPVHGHTALFGVYGMLGSGTDAVLPARAEARRTWKEDRSKLSFWLLTLAWSSWWCSACCRWPDAGLGLDRTWHLVRTFGGVHAVRPMQTLRWMRVPGDILFALGAALFAWFVLGF